MYTHDGRKEFGGNSLVTDYCIQTKANDNESSNIHLGLAKFANHGFYLKREKRHSSLSLGKFSQLTD